MFFIHLLFTLLKMFFMHCFVFSDICNTFGLLTDWFLLGKKAREYFQISWWSLRKGWCDWKWERVDRVPEERKTFSSQGWDSWEWRLGYVAFSPAIVCNMFIDPKPTMHMFLSEILWNCCKIMVFTPNILFPFTVEFAWIEYFQMGISWKILKWFTIINQTSFENDNFYRFIPPKYLKSHPQTFSKTFHPPPSFRTRSSSNKFHSSCLISWLLHQQEVPHEYHHFLQYTNTNVVINSRVFMGWFGSDLCEK